MTVTSTTNEKIIKASSVGYNDSQKLEDARQQTYETSCESSTLHIVSSDQHNTV
jgi:hypothetical protein